MSCGAPEARTAREPARVVAKASPTLQNAIAVIDDRTVALFARLIPGRTPPSTLTITFYGGENVLDEFEASVYVLGADVVHAVPLKPPTIQEHTILGPRATVAMGSDVYPVDLWYSYPPCPDCITYFMCHCLKKMYGVNTPVAPCPPVDNYLPACPVPDQFKPIH